MCELRASSVEISRKAAQPATWSSLKPFGHILGCREGRRVRKNEYDLGGWPSVHSQYVSVLIQGLANYMRQTKQLLTDEQNSCFYIYIFFFFFFFFFRETANVQHDCLLLPLKCQGLRRQLTQEPEPSSFCSSLLVSTSSC